MDANYQFEAGNDASGAGVMVHERLSRDVAMKEERLPFTVSIVRNEEKLAKAVSIRHSAYGRHLPVLAETLKEPEINDLEPGSVVLLAESKLDGSPIGTMRIQTNEFKKLAVEDSLELPAYLRNASMAEATRLGVSLGRVGRLVKTVLFKAFYQYCVEADIEWMVIAGRAPLDKQYESLLFHDVVPGGGFIPLRHAANLPHRVLAFEVETAQERWANANHPLFDFMVRTHHPDIDFCTGRSDHSHASVLPVDFGRKAAIRA
jgi:hypothetical protein